MPYGKSKSKSTRSRTRRTVRKGSRFTYRSRSRRYARAVQSFKPQWKNPLPRKAYYKFKYYEQSLPLAFSALNGYTNTYAFRGNSLYDPNFSGLGGQVQGFDQLCSADGPFNRYIVYGAKIKVFPHWMDESIKPRAFKLTLCALQDNALDYANLSSVMSVPGSRTVSIESDADLVNNKLSIYSSTRKLWFVKNLDDVTFASPYDGNPTHQWYFYVVGNNFAAQTSPTFKFDVQITYYAELNQTNDIGDS